MITEEHGDAPPHYKQAAALLKSLMFRDFKFGIFPIPAILNAQTETEKWLNPFED